MKNAVHCLTVQPTDHLLSATFCNSVTSPSPTTTRPKILNPTVMCDMRSAACALLCDCDWRVAKRETVQLCNFRNAAELQTEQTAATFTKKRQR